MVETKSPNEALGVDLIKKLLKLPMSLDILRESFESQEPSITFEKSVELTKLCLWEMN